jgi:hypothetical protein
MKRTFLKFALLVAAGALTAGCATGPKHDEMASSIPSLKPGEGRIYFFRRLNMGWGAGIQPDIKLNGQVVGKSMPGGFFFVDRPAGNYVASVMTETEKTLSFTLAPGETKYVRSSPGLGVVVYRIALDLETREKAMADLGSLSYTGEPLASK